MIVLVVPTCVAVYTCFVEMSSDHPQTQAKAVGQLSHHILPINLCLLTGSNHDVICRIVT